ncbi:arsenite methyltransferase isoform X2 [Patella vulgata]|uniref:arsenite methyltransferase isoform X2 n=1 Tax=Patella vulgata TaxID=6465 RepID=UPI00217F2CDE|nr:arsenite methyltransferase isoform X2 [Patella vulgata]
MMSQAYAVLNQKMSSCETEACTLNTVKDIYNAWSQSGSEFKYGYSGTLDNKIKEALSLVHPEITKRFYGCGVAVPEKLQGQNVLDLGCGSGRESFVISSLIGPNGHVTGIDMTEDLVKVANEYIDYHKEKYGIEKTNMEFKLGYIEKLGEIGIGGDSCDVLVSNGVINLTPDKKAVLAEAYRVLKTGGELYFSDVYCSTELSDDVRKNQHLWGQCIAGTLWWKKLFDMAKEIGFSEPRLVEVAPVPICNKQYKDLLGDARFLSATYRLFKLPDKTSTSAILQYQGDIPGCESAFRLDVRNIFKKGELRPVDGTVATIITTSRFKDNFKIIQNQVINPFDYLDELDAGGNRPVDAYSVE